MLIEPSPTSISHPIFALSRYFPGKFMLDSTPCDDRIVLTTGAKVKYYMPLFTAQHYGLLSWEPFQTCVTLEKNKFRFVIHVFMHEYTTCMLRLYVYDCSHWCMHTCTQAHMSCIHVCKYTIMHRFMQQCACACVYVPYIHA